MTELASDTRHANEEAKREVLERRAEALARAPEAGRESGAREEIAIIEVGGDRLGIPVSGLREFVPCPPLAKLPGLPTWMAGVVQVRGELVSAIDLAARLGLEASAQAPRLAIVEARGGAVGLVVDRVAGFREIAHDELAQSYVGTTEGERLVRATTRDLVAILDLERLLDDGDLVIDLGLSE